MIPLIGFIGGGGGANPGTNRKVGMVGKRGRKEEEETWHILHGNEHKMLLPRLSYLMNIRVSWNVCVHTVVDS